MIEDATELLSELDVLVSLAHVAVNAPVPYVRPTIKPMGGGVIELIGARHPCMELMENTNFIPNDISLIKNKSSLQVRIWSHPSVFFLPFSPFC